jgi:hypothetical protein
MRSVDGRKQTTSISAQFGLPMLPIKGQVVYVMRKILEMTVSAFQLLKQTSLTISASWFDHGRDLLAMVNHFRGQMIRPIVGIGHSMGASQL